MILEELSAAVEGGKNKLVKQLTNQALEEGFEVQEILDCMIKAMGAIGERFSRNEIFVPEMLVAARAMSTGTKILEPLMNKAGIKTIGTVVIGTVKGDLHDIGKNLCAMMLRGIGATVYDLGVDVPEQNFVEKAEEVGADIICLSALLTTTMTAMDDVVESFRKAGNRDKYYIMVGGAPVTQRYAEEIGADAYTSDAGTCAKVAKAYLESKQAG